MRKSPLIIAAAVASTCASFALLAGAQPAPVEATPTTVPAAPTTQETLQKVSYGMGFQLGRNMKEVDVQLDVATLVKGIEDATAGKEGQFKDADIQQAFMTLQQMVAEKEQAKIAVAGEKAATDGKAFLDANKDKAGVKTTASGLQYQIETEGTGAQPKATDIVKVHYTGTLIDGTKFDSSRDRGEPIEFPLDQVIAGWTEGIQLLKVGSKAKLYIPSNLAYGPQGRPPQIAPNSTLVFDVELLDIVPPATQPAPGGLPGGMPQ